ncbi:hypothetical protein Ancab_000678 [Ancistrocladus abbreviatus]
MAAEGILSLSIASMVEDALKQHGSRLSDIDLASRKTEEAFLTKTLIGEVQFVALRRYEAAEWLRRTVGVVAAKDLPAEPSEEDFRIGLRSGIILCNVLNKVQPGSVPKVVEAPNDTVLIPDGAALMAYQYFENVRNFLVAVKEMGLPTFEASDLEQVGNTIQRPLRDSSLVHEDLGGKTARIVNCVLALKSYCEWKQGGGCGSWKFSGNMKQPTNGDDKQPSNAKAFLWKNSDAFMTSFSRNSSTSERSLESATNDGDLAIDLNCVSNTHSLSLLVRSLLSDKKPEEIPSIVESMLIKVMEKFELRLASQNESGKIASMEMPVSDPRSSVADASSEEIQKPDKTATPIERAEDVDQPCVYSEGSEIHVHRQRRFSEEQQSEWKLSEQQSERRLSEEPGSEYRLLEQQQRDVQVLKHGINTTKENMQVLQMTFQEELNHLGKHLHTLAHAASGYRKVLEENRKLYNQVQDLKGNVIPAVKSRLSSRVRPFLPGQTSYSSSVDHIEEGNITIMVPSKYAKDGKKSFTFNKVFGPSATQGSGKTYTMTGPNDLTVETFGVNYRALNDLFLLAEQRKDTMSYEVSVQMMEIYNEQVRDLLNGINVPDANRLPVSSTSDVINLMNLGHKNRAVSATAMNERSSRSHSCLTVHVQGKDLTSGAMLRGCMHLVDLAGSERVDKSGVTGEGLKEAQNINKSLSALGDVIAALAQKNTHVPYRNSKLTQLLQDALGGQAKTLMFVHISPEPDAVGETLSTLKFAERVSAVELGAARANKETGEVKALKEQIASLKAVLAKKDEEMEHLSSSVLSSSPESIRMKSTASSPSHPHWGTARGTSGGRKNTMEDAGNVKVKKNSVLKPRRRSLDPQDLLTNSPSWPLINGQKEEIKEIGSGDWIDKIVNQDSLDRRSSYGSVDEENQKMYYQGFEHYDTLKQPSNGFLSTKKDGQDSEVQIRTHEPSPADDLDELDVATSDSSELDFQVPLSLPRVSSAPNGLGSKTRKPQTKSVKSSEIRTSIPAPPSRRLSNGSVKSAKQPAPVKSKTANTK